MRQPVNSVAKLLFPGPVLIGKTTIMVHNILKRKEKVQIIPFMQRSSAYLALGHRQEQPSLSTLHSSQSEQADECSELGLQNFPGPVYLETLSDQGLPGDGTLEVDLLFPPRRMWPFPFSSLVYHCKGKVGVSVFCVIFMVKGSCIPFPLFLWPPSFM